MGGKKDFIHIRAGDDLKAALKASADRACRKESDHARYLLSLMLGLIDDSETHAIVQRIQSREIPVFHSHDAPAPDDQLNVLPKHRKPLVRRPHRAS